MNMDQESMKLLIDAVVQNQGSGQARLSHSNGTRNSYCSNTAGPFRVLEKHVRVRQREDRSDPGRDREEARALIVSAVSTSRSRAPVCVTRSSLATLARAVTLSGCDRTVSIRSGRSIALSPVGTISPAAPTSISSPGSARKFSA
jgi:hypothetical protein